MTRPCLILGSGASWPSALSLGASGTVPAWQTWQVCVRPLPWLACQGGDPAEQGR